MYRNFPHQICFNEEEAENMELILHMIEKEQNKKRDYNREAIKSLLITFFILIKRSISNEKKNISSTEKHNR